MAFIPRECFIKKYVDFKGFGFTLHAEVENGKCKGFINKIDEGSPAEYSGLLLGNRLVEVNGVNIEGNSYQHIIEKIIASGDKVRLLVVDRETDDYYEGLGLTITAPGAQVKHQDLRPDSPAPSYTDAIQQQYTDIPGTSNSEEAQQFVGSVSTNNDHCPPRNTHAPISYSIPETKRQTSSSGSRYRTYGTYTWSRPSGYSALQGTIPPTTNDCAAWFACLRCCWPAALVALVKICDARECAARGDMIGAHAAADSARKWTRIRICFGVVGFVIAGVYIGVLRTLYQR